MIDIDTGFASHLFERVFTTTFAGSETLLPAEKALITTWAPKRVAHFSTGRQCARQALTQLGYQPAAILIGTMREPLWPDGVVGSISHSQNMAGALVASTSTIKGVGLDIETMGKISADMWNLIFTPAEQAFLAAQNPLAQPYFTTAFFSIKEAFYKLQYPVTTLFLDYHDVEITYTGDGFNLQVIADTPMPAGFIIQCVLYQQEVISIALLP